MFKKSHKSLFALVIALFFVGTSVSFAEGGNEEGKNLFKAKCSTCHAPHRDMTGPALFQMREQWEEDGHGDLIYDWVNNWKKTAALHSYAKEVSDWSPAAMQLFPNLTKDQIDAIFDYVDSTPKPGAKKAGSGEATATTGGQATKSDEGDSLGMIWYVLGGIFLVIIFSASAIKRQLKDIEGKETPAEKRIGSKKWMWVNKKWLLLSAFVVAVGIITYVLLLLYDVNVMTAYHPTQPITFRHDIHAGINGIDCKYCHNGANKSKTSGIPTLNVCMNCHKFIKGENEFQQKEISKLYSAVGYDPDKRQYTGKQKPIVWNKVHNLPDFVFFSHKQHVVVGGIDCKQCHGDMTKRHKTAEVMPVEELNKIEGNIDLGDHPTLTMGWCIACHEKKAVSKGPLNTRGGYYTEMHKRLLKYDKEDYAKFLEDGKVTEKELGGWECGKCHY